MKLKEFDMKEGTDYRIAGDSFVCIRCGRSFQKRFKAQKPQAKIAGTKQLLSLWAWYNFKRHIFSHFVNGDRYV